MWCDDIFEKDWEIAVRMYIKIKSLFLLQIWNKLVPNQVKIGKIVYCTYKYFVQQNVSDGSKTLLYHRFYHANIHCILSKLHVFGYFGVESKVTIKEEPSPSFDYIIFTQFVLEILTRWDVKWIHFKCICSLVL